MSTQLRPAPNSAQGRPAQFTDSEAPTKYHWLIQYDPDAYGVYMEALAAIREQLNGMSGYYSHNGIPEHGQAQARGDMYFTLPMLCRLLTATNPKGLAAADAFLDVAAKARGKVVINASDAHRIEATLTEAVKRTLKESSEAHAAAVEAIDSGDPADISRAHREAVEASRATLDLVAVLQQAGGAR